MIATKIVRFNGDELEFVYLVLLLLVSLAAIYLGKWRTRRLIMFVLTIGVLIAVAKATRDVIGVMPTPRNTISVPVGQVYEA